MASQDTTDVIDDVKSSIELHEENKEEEQVYESSKGVVTIIGSDKQSQQQRKLNAKDSCWNFCKNDDIESLKTSTIDYSRGAFGENILHAALLFGSNKSIKWLIKNHPKLALQIYEDDEYYGESILHMIIATNNIDILDYILNKDNNIDIDLNILINKLRAIGHFFNSEWGTVHYGEYALQFAVSLNQIDTVTKLLKNGANIDCVDSNGNTIFHYISRYNLVDMFNHIVSEELRSECNIKSETFYELIEERNNEHFTFFQYAAHLKQKEIFECILEWKRIDCWKWGPVSFVAYPLNEIDTDGDNKNSILETILADNCTKFIDIPVIQAIFNQKWNDYAKIYFYIWCVLSILYVITILVLYMKYIDEINNNNLTLKVFILVITGFKLFITLYQTISEVASLISEHGRKRGMDIYFQWNLPDISIIECFHILLAFSNCMIIGVWISIFMSHNSFIIIFMTLSFITECLYLLYFGQSTELLGRLVISILKIITGDMVRFFVIFIIILFAFAGAICFMYPPIDLRFDNAFKSLFYISLGEGDYWVNDDDEIEDWQITFNEIIYVAFLIVSAVLLLNLLIAIFSETIEEIGQDSYNNWLFQRASTILLIERRADKNCMKSKIYKRTGVKGETYGFEQEHKEYFFIAFNLVNNKLKVPTKRPTDDILDKVLQSLKNNIPKKKEKKEKK